MKTVKIKINADLDKQDVEANVSDDEIRRLIDEITPANDVLLRMTKKNPPDPSWHAETPQTPPQN